METKQFTAESIKEGIAKVKDELGSEAVILNAKKVKTGQFGLFGKEVYQITATKDLVHKQRSMRASIQDREMRLSKSDIAPIVNQIKDGEVKIVHPIRNDISELRELMENVKSSITRRESETQQIKYLKTEINDLKGMIQSMQSPHNRSSHGLNDNLLAIYQQLTFYGLKERYALGLLKECQLKVPEAKLKDFYQAKLYLARLLVKFLKVKNITEEEFPLVLSFIGPTGVGKTTTLAKIAANLRKKDPNKKIALITTDTYRLGAIDQLQEFAQKIRVKLAVAHTAKEFNRTLQNFMHNEVILIDTLGVSQRDVEKINQLKEYLYKKSVIKNCLVLSSGTKDNDLTEITKRYNEFDIDSVIFTKLDEATSYGSIINHCLQFNYPVSYLTNGQDVPEDIEEATKERLIDLMLNISGELNKSKE